MKRCALWFIAVWARVLLRLRYRIEYRGLKEIKAQLKNSQKGCLFLSNHPANFVDPVAVMLPIALPYNVRPLVTEYMFFNPFFHQAMRCIRALPVPNFASGFNPLKLNRLDKTLRAVADGVKAGERFLIYPSGTTKLSGREIIGGAFAVHDLISSYPDVQIVLVRVSGLWGSRFSRAHTDGQTVCLPEVFRQSIKDLLAAALFFLPKRKVTIEYEMAPADFPRTGTKQVVNRYLEAWFNKPFEKTATKGESCIDVPYSFWRKPKKIETKGVEEPLRGIRIPKEVQDDILEKIAEIASISSDTISVSSHLIADLNLDSLNIAELITFLETTYDVKQIDPESLTTVATVLLAATHQIQIQVAKEIEWNMDSWNEPRNPERIFLGESKNLLAAFFDVSWRHLFETIVSDTTSGPMSYYAIRSRVMLMAHAIEKLPGKHIGILLPSSVGAQILILACQMADKVPVMLNWTVGGKHLEAVVSLSQLQAVLTSWGFLDRLDNVDLRPIQEILVVLEEMKATFSWFKMATCPIKALLPGRILRKCALGGAARYLQGDDEAVILFTSGTENMPKGVPLSHRNLLSNMRATLQLIDLYSTDRLLGSLPPFHSFGFALTGLLPLLAGIRVFYTPNPTDSGLQARVIRKWGITIICSAPSFLLNVLRQGRKDVYNQVRLVVAGAEKPTNELYELAPVAAPNSTIWVGYGITECSPVLTVNTIGDPAHGAGKAIPGVRLRIVDVDDFSRTLSANQSGMILAAGPNVFEGYLQKDVHSPFYEKDDVRWYVTGDLGYLSEDGYLTITGRLKRFVKIGGEMVSLGAIEAALGSIKLFVEDEGPQFAVCSKGESEGRPRLVLFATKSLPVTQINSILRQQGFSNLVRIDHVVTVETIPLSGTGKVAYRELEATII